MIKRNNEIMEMKAREIAMKLIGFSTKNINEVYEELNTTSKGLKEAEVEKRLEEYGENQMSYEKPAPWYKELFMSFMSPFTTVLIIIGIASVLTDIVFVAPQDRSYSTVFIIALMILLSGLLKFFQEFKSSKAAEELKTMVSNTAAVKRSDSALKEIDIKDIVKGDVIYLAAGDMIPADVRIIRAKDLFIGQSSLTGESEPVEKYSEVIECGNNVNVADLNNICLLGTTVISGCGKAVVVSTGDETYFGAMAKSLSGTKEETSFEKGVNSIGLLLVKFMMAMVPVVFFINGFTKHNWIEALLFAISIAVGLTPQMLPMILTSNLAKGAVKMARKKTIVKKLDAIQNFGAMDILCTDKTGTLTLDKIIVERYLNVHGEDDERVLRHAYLNSFYQTGLRNLMDIAILNHGEEFGFEELKKKYTKIDEIPFDFSRRRMSVVLVDKEGKSQLITKGAVEEMLSICSMAEYHGQVVNLTEELKDKIKKTIEDLNNEGMRVIAVAQKNHVAEEGSFAQEDETDMVLIGYIGFLDPPKESASCAISALKDYGVAVKVLTGDNDSVTKKICMEVGVDSERLLLGWQIDDMSDEELADKAEKTSIFAKLSPMQKSRIVKVLKENGHVVGFMGDGINDAPALKVADVGISVDTAVDIAKESADIILLEKSLMVLEEGVIEGRRVFGNIIKYIKMAVSSNFGNVFSVLVASIFLPFLPMVPIQLLTQNLLYDISQISIPWDNMDEEYLKMPRKWNADDIGRFMIFIGPISSIFDIITFIVMFTVFKANVESMQGLFQAGWFIEGLLSQTLIVHMIRTKKVPFLQSRASYPVLLLTMTIMVIGVAIPFTTLGTYLGFQMLPLSYFPWLIGILLCYCILTQVVKKLYIKKYGEWL